MPGLPWVRLDTAWPQNPKFLMLADDKRWRAIAVYMGGLAYAGRNGTNGFLPYFALPTIHATRREAEQLIAVQLWHPCEGGYEINDWDDHQESNDVTLRRRKKAQDAAYVRWHTTNGDAPSIP